MAQVHMTSLYNPRTGIKTHLVKATINKLGKQVGPKIRASGHGHILTCDYQYALTSTENHKWAEKAFFDHYKEKLPSWCQSAKLELYKGLKGK